MKKNKTKTTRVTQKRIKKLTPDDLKKVTGGLCRDCVSMPQPYCIAYLINGTQP